MRIAVLVESLSLGRLALYDPKQGYGPDLTRGQPLDIWLLNTWWHGHVEYADQYGGYYFLGNDGMISLLYVEMWVRLP